MFSPWANYLKTLFPVFVPKRQGTDLNFTCELMKKQVDSQCLKMFQKIDDLTFFSFISVYDESL